YWKRFRGPIRDSMRQVRSAISTTPTPPPSASTLTRPRRPSLSERRSHQRERRSAKYPLVRHARSLRLNPPRVDPCLGHCSKPPSRSSSDRHLQFLVGA